MRNSVGPCRTPGSQPCLVTVISMPKREYGIQPRRGQGQQTQGQRFDAGDRNWEAGHEARPITLLGKRVRMGRLQLSRQVCAGSSRHIVLALLRLGPRSPIHVQLPDIYHSSCPLFPQHPIDAPKLRHATPENRKSVGLDRLAVRNTPDHGETGPHN